MSTVRPSIGALDAVERPARQRVRLGLRRTDDRGRRYWAISANSSKGATRLQEMKSAAE